MKRLPHYYVAPGCIDNPQTIIAAVCDAYRLTVSELQHNTRQHRYSEAKQVMAYLLRKKYPDKKTTEIAALLNNSNVPAKYFSVYEGINTITDRISVEQPLREKINTMLSGIHNLTVKDFHCHGNMVY
jgi:chromosomal replication initiation ATPase DnaA